MSNKQIDEGLKQWEELYSKSLPNDKPRTNRSNIKIKPIYTPNDWDSDRYMEDLGFPGEEPMARGIYPTMHRGQTWSQRQLVGLATPELYNTRVKQMIANGANALSMIPCNSVYRGLDVDLVDPVLLGTCGITINTVGDMAKCLKDIPIDKMSIGLNDPIPFTMLAQVLAHAKNINVPWNKLTGTSNQSDYISHYVANHMFFRLALKGSRRVQMDEISFLRDNCPGWNPVSVVGQHMQQAGATPAEAMGLTLSTAIQYGNDCVERGMLPDSFLPRFTFFFDISISYFEEIAKFRAGRRVWARITKERFGAKDPRSSRFKFHCQTSGVDLTRVQPLNNIARVAIQGIAGILGGCQSMHTDGYDEALSCPTEEAALISVATQNILKDEAGLTDVIDALGGSYYLETLTNQMEEEIEATISRIDAAGGMFLAVESGLVQGIIGESAMAHQEKVDSGEHKIVGVNAYVPDEDDASNRKVQPWPDQNIMAKHIEDFCSFKENRDDAAVQRSLDKLSEAAKSDNQNVYEQVVQATINNATQGEIITRLRDELGFGNPLINA
ncbi:MAG: acyl-CoA mutase large subunit family protein [Alphaproteobacteria bacterium]|nr:acyl-CoA mutase large subunit family protein [Alphaproteobacteria bacterium]